MRVCVCLACVKRGRGRGRLPELGQPVENLDKEQQSEEKYEPKSVTSGSIVSIIGNAKKVRMYITTRFDRAKNDESLTVILLERLSEPSTSP
jgi:hypothetical protein